MSAYRSTRRPLVAEIMSAPLVVLDEHASVWRALERMTASGLHHLVVLDQARRLVGVLEDRQVLSVWPDEVIGSSRRTVRETIRRTSPEADKAWVRDDAPVHAAAQTMLDLRVNALAVVTAEHEVVGIVTGSDLARCLIQLVGEASVEPRPDDAPPQDLPV
jgi:CBS domain-containing protein